ncbi:MAG: hypothetical protein AUF79_18250 [Crenarchaeota archaeon 13_1_20CM_2_51_8]|nr:MAG: hypothetical protein AUF79_18250 [Crenarchaeota archaeon 13_1_20CM_2_51_8]
MIFPGLFRRKGTLILNAATDWIIHGLCLEPQDSPNVNARQEIFSRKGSGVLHRAPRDARAWFGEIAYS